MDGEGRLGWLEERVDGLENKLLGRPPQPSGRRRVGKPTTLADIRDEYMGLAERNKRLITRGLRRTHWILGAIVAVLLAIAAVTVVSELQHSATLVRIQEGRRTAINLNCAVASGVIQAGRLVILSSGARLPDSEARRLGLPPLKVREQLARRTADAYVGVLVRTIARIAGSSAVGVLRRDGQIDCSRWLTLAQASRR